VSGNSDQLRNVPKDPGRRLLALAEFLRLFPHEKLNIELKECFTTAHLDRFIRVLNDNIPERVGVVASSRNGGLLQDFRNRTGARIATNLSLWPLVQCRIASVFHLVRFLDIRGRALELPYKVFGSPKSIIEQVRKNGGCTYVFLTAFPLIHGLDSEEDSLTSEAIFEILDRGVDGIMTDQSEPGSSSISGLIYTRLNKFWHGDHVF
jgi:hypothetical protein